MGFQKLLYYSLIVSLGFYRTVHYSEFTLVRWLLSEWVDLSWLRFRLFRVANIINGVYYGCNTTDLFVRCFVNKNYMSVFLSDKMTDPNVDLLNLFSSLWLLDYEI